MRALADPDRLRIAGLIADRELTTAGISAELALPAESVTAHLAVLGRAGLIVTTRDRHERRVCLRVERLAEIDAWCAIRLESAAEGVQTGNSVPPGVRQFFRNGRLVSMPAKRSRYLDVLALLVNDFQPDKDYPEAEVNSILLERHEDFATLRRDLVDFGFMTRTSGIYRRLK